MGAHTQRQRFHALQEHECIERCHGAAKVAQQCGAGLHDVCNRPQWFDGLGPHGAVIGRVRRVERRLTFGACRFPIKIPAIDNDAANRRTMAADIFGRRVHNHSRAVVKRTTQGRAGGVVHNQWNAVGAADVCNFLDREDFQFGIWQRFGIKSARFIVNRIGEVLRVGRINEANLNAHVLQRIGEQVPCPAIQVRRRNNIVTGAGDVLQRHGRRGLTGGHGKCCCAAFQGRNALFQHIGCRVHDAGINIAKLRQGEQVRGMFRVIELIAGGLMNRNGNRAGGWIGAPTCVQCQCFGF